MVSDGRDVWGGDVICEFCENLVTRIMLLGNYLEDWRFNYNFAPNDDKNC